MQTTPPTPLADEGLEPAAELRAAAALEAASDLARRVRDGMESVVRGKPEVVRAACVALLSGGHLLVEDVPGVGKTLLAKSLARLLGGTFRRVQGTPDLLPSELTGVSVFHLASNEWEFRPGPLFANVVLVDELNRATPRTQAALLEAMEEHQITVDGATHPLPRPFFLVATQNPFEHAGTFPLVEGQLDRFTMVVEIGAPDPETEAALLLGRGGERALDELEPTTTPDALAQAMAAVRRVHCEPVVAQYVVAIANATRRHDAVATGASPRASLALLHAAQAHAVLDGRDYVVPDDVKQLTSTVLAHRIVLHDGLSRVGAQAVVHELLATVPVPRG